MALELRRYLLRAPAMDWQNEVMTIPDAADGFDCAILHIRRTDTFNPPAGQPIPSARVMVTLGHAPEIPVLLEQCSERVRTRAADYMARGGAVTPAGPPSQRQLTDWSPFEVQATPSTALHDRAEGQDSYEVACPLCGEPKQFCAAFEDVFDRAFALGTHDCKSGSFTTSRAWSAIRPNR